MKRGRPQPLCIYAQFKSDGRATIRQKPCWEGGVLRVEARETKSRAGLETKCLLLPLHR